MASLQQPTNGWFGKFLAGCVWAALISILTFMSNTIQANERENTKDHTAIRRETVDMVQSILESQSKILIKLGRIEGRLRNGRGNDN